MYSRESFDDSLARGERIVKKAVFSEETRQKIREAGIDSRLIPTSEPAHIVRGLLTEIAGMELMPSEGYVFPDLYANKLLNALTSDGMDHDKAMEAINKLVRVFRETIGRYELGTVDQKLTEYESYSHFRSEHLNSSKESRGLLTFVKPRFRIYCCR